MSSNIPLNFDASSVPPSAPMEPMPSDWYTAKITAFEMKPTKDHATSGSEYLKTEYTIIDGKYANRKVWHNLNLKNANPDAVRIAYEQLSAICHATGRIKIGTTDELLGLPMSIRVTLRAATQEYDAQNEVKGWKALEGGASGGVAGGPSMAGLGSSDAPAVSNQPSFSDQQSQAAPGIPGAPTAPAAPAPAHDPVAAALADGWTEHPENSEYVYKGQEVITKEAVAAKYPAPAAPAVPSAPVAPSAPAAVAQAGSEAPTQKAPWET